MLLASQRYALGRALARPVADMLRRPGLTGAQRFVNGSTSFEQASPRIDWSKTVAYSYPVPEGIYLNPENPALANGGAAAAVRELRERLERFPDARIEVLDPSSFYHGPATGRAPALLLRIDGMATELWMDFRYERALVKDRPKYFYGSGTHRMNGILLAGGDGVGALAPGPNPRLTDLAPTILETMGFPAPTDLAGRSFASGRVPAA